MANIKISQLTSAATLTGAEEVPVVQGSSTVKTTAQDIADLAGGGGTLDVVTVGTLGTTPLAVSYSSKAYLNPAAGTQSAPIVDIPAINLGTEGTFLGTLSSISFPSLTAASINIQNISTLTTIDLPLLDTAVQATMSSITFSSNSSLTTLNIPSLLNLPSSINFSWFNNAFSQTTVNNILVQMVATGRTNGYIDLSGGTSSAPSGTGLAAKTTLEGNGWTVSTN